MKFSIKYLLLLSVISVGCNFQKEVESNEDLKIEGNWKLVKTNKPEDFNKYHMYQELYIDSNTISTITEIGLISIEEYQIFKTDSIYIDNVLSNTRLKVHSDTLFFYNRDDTIQYLLIKRGLKPKSYLDGENKEEFWEDFYLRQDEFKQFLKSV